MRPAWRSRTWITPEMGRVFNMHPGCMGSIIETAALGRKIKSWGRRAMIGDGSLVGPCCPVWEQIAVGLGADWVEAIEKPHENTVFQECTIHNPIRRREDGRFEIAERRPGFGVEIDTAALSEKAFGRMTLS